MILPDDKVNYCDKCGSELAKIKSEQDTYCKKCGTKTVKYFKVCSYILNYIYAHYEEHYKEPIVINETHVIKNFCPNCHKGEIKKYDLEENLYVSD